MLLPKLTSEKIRLSWAEGDKVVNGYVWKSVGLAIHKDENKKWVVTHVVSGCGVLFDIPTKIEAMQYLKDLKTLEKDWFFSYEYLRTTKTGLYGRLKKEVMKIRSKIYKQGGTHGKKV